jgi:hypothetical protein
MRYLLIFAFIALQSCSSESDKIFFDGGLSVSFFNKTGNEFPKGVLYIGAIVNSDFIITDSLDIGNIATKSINDDIATRTVYPLPPNDWQPNLDKIKSKSDKGLFYIKINGILQSLFFNEFHFPKPKLDGTNLSVWIEDKKLFVFDGKVDKQDFNIIK